MTEAEADELFQKLIGLLRSKYAEAPSDQRDNLVEAIEREIESGKPVPVRLKVRGDKFTDDPIAGGRQAGASSSGEFIQRKEYTAEEKLAILLDGLSLARVAPPLMAQTIIDTIERCSGSETVIEMQMADDQADVARRSIDRQSIQTQVSQTAALEHLLEEVRQELGKRSPLIINDKV